MTAFASAGGYAQGARRLATQQARSAPRLPLHGVAEKDDISMPELAGELHAASGVKADPAWLSHG